MLTYADVNTWTSYRVVEWLKSLFEETDWLNAENIIKNNINGKKLLLLTGHDLRDLGIVRVGRQEAVLEAIEDLRFQNYSAKEITLQTYILRVACQANSLRACLELDKQKLASDDNNQTGPANDASNRSSVAKQIVSLETLTTVSNIVSNVQLIADILGRPPFARQGNYRPMRSLLLALSIELTSTAQRDQFVERPNDIIKKCCRTLADNCDRIVEGTEDFLLIQQLPVANLNDEREANRVQSMSNVQRCNH